MNVEERLRHSLAEHAASVPDPPDRWSEVEAGAAEVRRRNRRRVAGLTGLGLVAAVCTAVLAVGILRDGSVERVETRPSDRPAEGVEPSPFLWPFRSLAEAREWQEQGAPQGHSPWHADAEATALAFTTGFLGFNDIDRVLHTEISGDEARVTIGYEGESGDSSPAAIIRLIRLGQGDRAPWEVVGTVQEKDMTITEPTPGRLVSSPLTVGGIITGVDESIRVTVRQPSSPDALGEACCEGAGGWDRPWNTTVAFAGATDPVLTVVASIGGHVSTVERFTVVGVRPR